MFREFRYLYIFKDASTPHSFLARGDFEQRLATKYHMLRPENAGLFLSGSTFDPFLVHPFINLQPISLINHETYALCAIAPP